MPSSNFNMSDVFISYSRRDKTFVERLDAYFKAEGQETWVDWEDIPEGADWWKEIQGGIEGSNTFVFVISPDSVISDVCHNEIDYAIKNHKRFVPVVYREVVEQSHKEKMHPAISSHNWLFMRDRDNFDHAFGRLKEVLATDLSYIRMHTRILVRSRDWDFHGRKNGYLLIGDELDEAEEWLKSSEGKQPRPTELQTQYLLASRSRQQALQRRLFIGVAAALIISVILTVLSVVLFFMAQQSEKEAQTNLRQAQNIQALFLADLSRQQLNTNNVEIALALAQESLVNLNAGIFHVDSERALWNAINASGQERAHMDHGDNVQGALWNADESRLLTYANDGGAYLWLNNGSRVASLIHPSSVRGAVWSPDSTLLLTWTNTEILHVWTADGVEQAQMIHGDRVTGAMWNSDGRMIVSWSADGTIHTWDTSGNQLGVVGHDSSVTNVLWNANETQLISWSTDRTVRIWDMTTWGSPALTAVVSHGNDTRIRNVVYSYDSTRFLSIGADNTARIWDQTGAQVANMIHTDTISGGLWNNTNTLIATWDVTGQVMIWDANATGDLTTPLITFSHNNEVLGARWNADGTRLMTWGLDSSIYIWNTSTLSSTSPLVSIRQLATGVIWNRDETQILTWSTDGTARIWDATAGSNLVTFPHREAVTGATWSSDETLVLTWSEDDTARIWQADGNVQWRSTETITMPSPTSEPILIGDGTIASPGGASSLSISEGEVTVTTSGTSVILDAKGFVEGAVWSPNSTMIATFAPDTVQIWQSDGTLLESLDPKGEIFGVLWRNDEQRILLWVDNNTVQVWDIDTAELIYDFSHASSVLWADWNADNSRINVWLATDTARVWIVNVPTLLRFAESRYLTDLNNDQREEFFLPLLEPTSAPSP